MAETKMKCEGCGEEAKRLAILIAHRTRIHTEGDHIEADCPAAEAPNWGQVMAMRHQKHSVSAVRPIKQRSCEVRHMLRQVWQSANGNHVVCVYLLSICVKIIIAWREC